MSAAQDRMAALAAQFVECLEELACRAGGGGTGSARADLARLKRCAGKSPEECTSILPLFYRILPAPIRGRDRQESDYLLVASLFPLAPAPYDGNLGASISQLAIHQPQSRDGLDRRMRILLDSSREALPFRLRQTVRLLATQGVGIGWERLLVDLQRWDWEGKPVQKEWAREYFGRPLEETEAVSTEDEKGETDAC